MGFLSGASSGDTFWPPLIPATPSACWLRQFLALASAHRDHETSDSGSGFELGSYLQMVLGNRGLAGGKSWLGRKRSHDLAKGYCDRFKILRAD